MPSPSLTHIAEEVLVDYWPVQLVSWPCGVTIGRDGHLAADFLIVEGLANRGNIRPERSGAAA
jgi:hypothetical protein